jgi:hypothetical protein
MNMDTLLAGSLSVHRLWITPLLTLSCVAVLSCLQPRPSSECRRFYNLSPQQREAKIRVSPVKEQLTLYECGMYQEPPTDYAGDVAEGGERIIPAVLDQLKAESSETRQDFLIHIFEELALKEHLRGKRDVVEQLKQVASTMKDDNIKRRSQRRLKVIEDNL